MNGQQAIKPSASTRIWTNLELISWSGETDEDWKKKYLDKRSINDF